MSVGGTGRVDEAAIAILREQFGGGSDFDSLVALFETNGFERLDKLDAAIRDNDLETIKLISHSLKGSAATLGAVGLAECAREVEADPLRAGDLLPALHSGLRESLERLRTPGGAGDRE